MNAKTSKRVRTIEEAEAVYGGLKKLASANKMSIAKNGNAISNWKARGEVPPGRHLGLYIGLLVRGAEPTPRLFGVDKWSEIPGVGVDVRKPPRGPAAR